MFGEPPRQLLLVPALSGTCTNKGLVPPAPCARAHCITSRCPLSAAPHMASHPTGSRAPVPTATPPSARPMRRMHNSPHVPLAAVPHRLQHLHIPFHGQSCSRPHCSTSRCPPSTATRTSVPAPRTALLPRPLAHRQVPALSGVCALTAVHG